MSIFKEHKSSADRSATDRRRHKEKIERAIKDGIHDIVAEESIIGQDGKKRIKIPVRGIKEYQFIYGKNNKRVGSGQGKDVSKGQQIGKASGDKRKKGKGDPDKPGNSAGEEYYEVDISLDELAKYLFDDLNLPDLEKKSFPNIFSNKIKRKGYRKEGIRPRLSKKETIKRKIRRKKASIKAGSYDPESDERFTFHEDDLKYKHTVITKKNVTNAVIFFIMDTSGSMTKQKKFKARSFFFLLYQFIRYRYDKTEIVFISHTTEAKETNEGDFFGRGSSGGTFISSGLEKAVEIIDKRYPPNSWNLYTFHCSDGDNWLEDNEKAKELSIQLTKICQLYSFIEITEGRKGSAGWGASMSEVYRPLVCKNFKIAEIKSKEDVWLEFKKLFGNYDE
jgi:sporulation protein YhbH